MSLRGIDGQMMIARANTYVRDASAQIRSGQTQQDFIAHHNKELAELEKHQVQELAAGEAARLMVDDRKGGAADQQGTPKKKKKKGGPQAGEEPNVGEAAPSVLDIKI